MESFRDDQIPDLLATYLNDGKYRKWNYAQASRIRRELTQLNFAYWDENQRAYVLDEGIRRILRWKRNIERNS